MIKIYDKGTYFLVVWDGLERSTFPKSYDGFRTADELRTWLETRDLGGL